MSERDGTYTTKRNNNIRPFIFVNVREKWKITYNKTVLEKANSIHATCMLKQDGCKQERLNMLFSFMTVREGWSVILRTQTIQHWLRCSKEHAACERSTHTEQSQRVDLSGLWNSDKDMGTSIGTIDLNWLFFTDTTLLLWKACFVNINEGLLFRSQGNNYLFLRIYAYCAQLI